MADTLVQPIIVDPCGHEETILAAALASAGLLGHTIDASTALGSRAHAATWDTWLNGRFTKSVRRIRRPIEREKVNRLAARQLPALRVDVEGAIATAFEPMAYSQYPPELKKLQVSGLDIAPRPDDAPPAERPSQFSLTPTIILDPDVAMSTGKAAAQAAHALGLWVLALSSDERALWLADTGARLEYARIDPDDKGLLVIRDSGLTEIPPDTATAAIPVP